MAVENMVLQLLHTNHLWPLLTALYREEDRRLSARLRELAARNFTSDLVGLRAQLLFPLPAALVELAALDMRTTPLDRLTAVHDTISQIETHARVEVHTARKAAESSPSTLLLAYPSAREEVLMLLGVLVKARPDHLASSLVYMQQFGFSAPPYMRDSLEVLREAVDLAEHVAMARIPWRRLATDLRLEDLVRLAESGRRPSMAAEAEMEAWRSRHGHLETHWKVRSSLKCQNK
jgi:hypothetical protein